MLAGNELLTVDAAIHNTYSIRAAASAFGPFTCSGSFCLKLHHQQQLGKWGREREERSEFSLEKDEAVSVASAVA